MIVSLRNILLFVCFILNSFNKCYSNDILGCGGFVKSHTSLDFSKIEIGLYTKEGSLKEKTECAPTNGYYFLPLYEKGEYVLKVHPPAGWSFEPSQTELLVDGVNDQCSTGQDINFSFNGFGITGKVITAGQSTGPSGISVQLVNEKGETRDTVTTAGGEFYFTPVIPGKYTVKASHQRWKLDPSQALVQVKEGNTALPVGVLAVKGYDVKGTATSFGNPISGLYVLLYSKEESPKFRVEGCKTALLQGVKDAPICHSITDASGEFSFGLVPAGEYRLTVLAKPPGQSTVSYNVKPDSVPFSVKHDSLYIKNAFDVTGFTIVGSAVTAVGGSGVSGARVLLDGKPVRTTDSAGKYVLVNLQMGTYGVTFEHEQCELDPIRIVISPNGEVKVPASRVVRWRVCGTLTPADSRRITIADDKSRTATTVQVSPENGGNWCTFLQPGVYTAKVEVSDKEQKEGLQFYPLIQTITVAKGPLSGISFSQLKATLSGKIICKQKSACESTKVTLKAMSTHGEYVGKPITTFSNDDEYKFKEVLPGMVEVSVSTERLCWQRQRHVVTISQSEATVPDLVHTGYAISIHSSHPIQVEYSSGTERGTLEVEAGANALCVPTAERYTLTPRGCHRFDPLHATIDTALDAVQSVTFTAVSHATVVKVISPEAAADVVLKVFLDDHGAKEVGPLVPLKQPQGGYLYEHTIYLADGEVAVVSAQSSTLLFHPSDPQQLVGASTCLPDALTLRAVRGLILAGSIVPPVDDVTITLTSTTEDVELVQVTSADGKYSFGPLDATKLYTITADKESYLFRKPDDEGNIAAYKLAEINVELLDDADGSPLQGALVSVSGDVYRRNLVSGADGTLRFASLAPAEYFVKPLMKEYRFAPPHHILAVADGRTHNITLRGVRVAWSCMGSLVSLGGVGWSPVTVLATPDPHSPAHCATEEASTERNGAFRIRGLLPKCTYTLHLKESTVPELTGLKLVKAPSVLEVKQNKDIVDVRLIAIQSHQTTDGSVLIYTPNIEHYKTLRLSVRTSDTTPSSSVYTTKLDPIGFSQNNNPGLMYVLPRLPPDNKSYVVQIESTLSKSTHTYQESAQYFTSNGQYKSINMEFLPKVRSTEQELRQTSLLVVPLVGALVIAFLRRSQVAEWLGGVAGGLVGGIAGGLAQQRAARPARVTRAELLDKASIEQIVNTVNAAGKKVPKKKVQ